jgi:16S rRNA (cytidine1402-2'-O)-methyltransferase
MMARVYVVGVPVGGADDLTLRARRILDEVTRIIVDDVDAARALLVHHGIETPVVEAEDVCSIRELEPMGDVALLYSGCRMAPAGDLARLVEAAAGAGVTAVPVPGSAWPVTTLVLSGLPADSFVYLGELPANPKAFADLLSSVRLESRTLLAEAALQGIGRVLADLLELLGDRPLAIATAREGEASKTWRGTLEEATTLVGSLPEVGPCSLVIGGSRGEPEPWAESRVLAHVEALLHQGLGVKEISQQVSGESAWARRDVYALAVRVREGLYR